MPVISLPEEQLRLACELRTKALAFNTRPTPSHAVALWINERRCGLLLPEAIRQIGSSALADRFSLQQHGCVMRADGGVDSALAQAARCFHAAGFFRQWRNELLDVRDLESQQRFAVAERGLFRFFGMATRCVYAVAISRDKRVFMSRRSLAKQVDPGLWDCLAAGLIAEGETPEAALAREIFEEAGLEKAAYRPLGRFSRFAVSRPVEDGWMQETAFCLNVQVIEERLVHNIDGEVDAIELVAPEVVLERIASGLVPWDTAVAFLGLFVDA